MSYTWGACVGGRRCCNDAEVEAKPLLCNHVNFRVCMGRARRFSSGLLTTHASTVHGGLPAQRSPQPAQQRVLTK